MQKNIYWFFIKLLVVWLKREKAWDMGVPGLYINNNIRVI